VIGIRSFGSNPRLVSSMVNSTIRGFRDEGIHTTLKHWPGHGSTTLDSHSSLPEITGTYKYFLNLNT
jgi:beta-N-acetylhexosaminidase